MAYLCNIKRTYKLNLLSLYSSLIFPQHKHTYTHLVTFTFFEHVLFHYLHFTTLFVVLHPSIVVTFSLSSSLVLEYNHSNFSLPTLLFHRIYSFPYHTPCHKQHTQNTLLHTSIPTKTIQRVKCTFYHCLRTYNKCLRICKGKKF